MKKTIILSIVFCALFAYMPFAAQAADATVTSVSATPSSTTPNESTSYDIVFNTQTNYIQPGESIYFAFSDASMSTIDYNCDPTAFVDADFDATMICDDAYNSFVVKPASVAVIPGTHSFSLNLPNPSSEGTYQLEVTTAEIDGHGDFSNSTISDSFTIGDDDAGSSGNAVDSLSVSPSTSVAGETVDLDLTYNITSDMSAGDKGYIVFAPQGAGPDESGFDFSNMEASLAAGDISEVMDCEATVSYMVICTMLAKINAVNNVGVTISNVETTSTAGDYLFLMTTVESPTSLDDYSYTDYTVTELTKPKKFKKKQIKIKNKKKKSAKLWCKARATATKYQFVLEKKKANKKGYKQVKKWKNVPTNYKIIKKKKNLLKSKTKFRFKARPGNAAGWAKWGPYKVFTMK